MMRPSGQASSHACSPISDNKSSRLVSYSLTNFEFSVGSNQLFLLFMGELNVSVFNKAEFILITCLFDIRFYVMQNQFINWLGMGTK